MRDWRLLVTAERVQPLHELHLLDAPQGDIASVSVRYELFAVWTEVYEFDAFADFELAQVPEVDRPYVIISARVILSISEIDGQLSLSDQSQVAEGRNVPRRDHLLNHLVKYDDFDADRLFFILAILRLVRLQASFVLILALHGDTNRILTELLILLVLLNEWLLAPFNL